MGSGKLFRDLVTHGETRIPILAQKIILVHIKKSNKILNLRIHQFTMAYNTNSMV